MARSVLLGARSVTFTGVVSIALLGSLVSSSKCPISMGWDIGISRKKSDTKSHQ